MRTKFTKKTQIEKERKMKLAMEMPATPMLMAFVSEQKGFSLAIYLDSTVSMVNRLVAVVSNGVCLSFPIPSITREYKNSLEPDLDGRYRRLRLSKLL